MFVQSFLSYSSGPVFLLYPSRIYRPLEPSNRLRTDRFIAVPGHISRLFRPDCVRRTWRYILHTLRHVRCSLRVIRLRNDVFFAQVHQGMAKRHARDRTRRMQETMCTAAPVGERNMAEVSDDGIGGVEDGNGAVQDSREKVAGKNWRKTRYRSVEGNRKGTRMRPERT